MPMKRRATATRKEQRARGELSEVAARQAEGGLWWPRGRERRVRAQACHPPRGGVAPGQRLPVGAQAGAGQPAPRLAPRREEQVDHDGAVARVNAPPAHRLPRRERRRGQGRGQRGRGRRGRRGPRRRGGRGAAARVALDPVGEPAGGGRPLPSWGRSSRVVQVDTLPTPRDEAVPAAAADPRRPSAEEPPLPFPWRGVPLQQQGDPAGAARPSLRRLRPASARTIRPTGSSAMSTSNSYRSNRVGTRVGRNRPSGPGGSPPGRRTWGSRNNRGRDENRPTRTLRGAQQERGDGGLAGAAVSSAQQRRASARGSSGCEDEVAETTRFAHAAQRPERPGTTAAGGRRRARGGRAGAPKTSSLPAQRYTGHAHSGFSRSKPSQG